jgi:hypothetical protein
MPATPGPLGRLVAARSFIRPMSEGGLSSIEFPLVEVPGGSYQLVLGTALNRTGHRTVRKFASTFAAAVRLKLP